MLGDSKKIKKQSVGSQSNKGRPQKGQQKPRREDKTKQYIADFPELEQIFIAIAESSNVRNINKTGPKTTKGVNQTVDVKESNRVIMERLKVLGKQDHIYFIRNQPCVLVIEGDQIIDKTCIQFLRLVYKQIPRPEYLDESYQEIYNKLNILARGLDDDFIDEFSEIVSLFFTKKNKGTSLEWIEDDIVNRVQTTEEFKIIKEWNTLRVIGQEIRLERAEQKLKRREEDVDQKHSDKIKDKYNGLIEKQRTEILEERKLGPLKYFIKNLVEGLDQLYETKLMGHGFIELYI